MNPPMVRAALVGAGRWGRRLVAAVQTGGRPKGAHIRFTAVVARDPVKAREFAAAEGLTLHGDLGAALKDPAIDAVVLATPHSAHTAEIEAAAAAGKHVFCEKPLALSRLSAVAAAEACAHAGVVLALGHNRRFLPAMQALHAMVADGALGTILHAEANFSGSFALGYQPGMWRAEESESPAGGMTAMGIHMVDALIAVMGPIFEARAITARRVLPVALDDTCAALLRLKDGASAYLGTMVATPRVWRMQVFGTKAWAHLRDHHILDVCGLDDAPRTRTFEAVDIERAELEAFARAVAGAAPYPVTLAEAVHGIAVQDAIIESARREGAAVAVAGGPYDLATKGTAGQDKEEGQ